MAPLLSIGLGLIAVAFTRPTEALAEADTLRLGAVTVIGNGPGLLSAGTGAFDIAEEGKGRLQPERSGAGEIEYRFGRKLLYYWGPVAGIVATGNGGAFGYGGFYLDLGIGRWTLSPLLSLGGYRRGDGKDLGGTFQFRSGMSLGYELAGGSRLGLSLNHLSNAKIYEENPGAELVLLTYSVPIPEEPDGFGR